MTIQDTAELQAVEKRAKLRRVDRKKEWYVAEWARLLDENERLKKRIHELTRDSIWSFFARVFNR